MRRSKLQKCPKTGKVRFPKKIDAKIALATAQAKDRNEKRFYRCPFCKDWHLTSQELIEKSEHIQSALQANRGIAAQRNRQESSIGGNTGTR